MKTFEEFVSSREQMDPSTHKMTDYQWKQAYAAYCSSRERLREGRKAGSENSSAGKESSDGAKRRRRSKSGRGMHQPSTVSELATLKRQIREQSAYSDLRLIIDTLAWVAIAVIIIIALLGMFTGFNIYRVISAVVGGGLNVLLVFVFKFLIQVIIDIPDIALYRQVQARAQAASESSASEFAAD